MCAQANPTLTANDQPEGLRLTGKEKSREGTAERLLRGHVHAACVAVNAHGEERRLFTGEIEPRGGKVIQAAEQEQTG